MRTLNCRPIGKRNHGESWLANLQMNNETLFYLNRIQINLLNESMNLNARWLALWHWIPKIFLSRGTRFPKHQCIELSISFKNLLSWANFLLIAGHTWLYSPPLVRYGSYGNTPIIYSMMNLVFRSYVMIIMPYDPTRSLLRDFLSSVASSSPSSLSSTSLSQKRKWHSSDWEWSIMLLWHHFWPLQSDRIKSRALVDPSQKNMRPRSVGMIN